MRLYASAIESMMKKGFMLLMYRDKAGIYHALARRDDGITESYAYGRDWRRAIKKVEDEIKEAT